MEITFPKLKEIRPAVNLEASSGVFEDSIGISFLEALFLLEMPPEVLSAVAADRVLHDFSNADDDRISARPQSSHDLIIFAASERIDVRGEAESDLFNSPVVAPSGTVGIVIKRGRSCFYEALVLIFEAEK
ncbi:MAG: hypothetical protein WCC06_10785 [Candidatus Aminicenantales bacterium]